MKKITYLLTLALTLSLNHARSMKENDNNKRTLDDNEQQDKIRDLNKILMSSC